MAAAASRKRRFRPCCSHQQPPPLPTIRPDDRKAHHLLQPASSSSSLAGHMHLPHVQPAALAKQASRPPFAPSSVFQRTSAPVPALSSRHGPATGTALGTLQASVESRPALHLHRAPPRWYPLQQPSRHSRASSPGAATASINAASPSYLVLLAPPPSLACTSSCTAAREPELQSTTQSKLSSSIVPPRLIAEEGLPTPSSYATNSPLA